MMTHSPALLNGMMELARRRKSAGIPTYAGTGSPTRRPPAQMPALSPAATNAGTQDSPSVLPPVAGAHPPHSEAGGGSLAMPPAPRSAVNIYPDLCVAVLGVGVAHFVPAFRLYLQARVIDGQGRGWVRVDALVGVRPRRRRQLITAGDGIFWQVQRGRIFYRSWAWVAYSLGIRRLRGRRVALAADDIIGGGIGDFKARLFGAWLTNFKNPISRDCIEALTGIPRRTQSRYCALLGIERVAGLALGDGDVQTLAWAHGAGTFRFLDHHGWHGQAGRDWVAWQLPNAHLPAFENTGPGMRRQHNRQLANLFGEEGTGNGERSGVMRRIFFSDPAKAARRFNRDPSADAYWQSGHVGGKFALWYLLEKGR